jgi:predicted acyltransferase
MCAGFDFTRERLRPARIACYWAHLLSAYAALLDFTPEPTSNSSEYKNIAAHLGIS